MPGIESKESSSGVKLLSAYKRGLYSVVDNMLLSAGLESIWQACPEMVVEQPPYPAQPWIFRVRPNFRYKFSGSAQINSVAPGDVSCESAGMQLALATTVADLTGTLLAPSPLKPGLFLLTNAARLSNTSALAQQMPISFDEWLIDCNDLLTINPSAQGFQVVEFMTTNNTSVAPHEANVSFNFQVAAAQFSDYRFDKWE